MSLRPTFWLSLVAISVAILTAPSAARAQQETGAQPAVSWLPTAPGAADTSAKTDFDISVSAALASDYIYRGYTLSDRQPSVSGDIEVTYGNIFADIHPASVNIPELSHLELTSSGGIRPVFGPLTFELGAEYFSYPGSEIHNEYLEFYAAPSYVVTTKLTLGLNAYYGPDYIGSGAWENYNSATFKYALNSSWSVSGELGLQSFGTTRPIGNSPAIKLPDYSYWNFGITYTYKSLTADVRYHGDTLSKQSCFLITGTGGATIGSTGCSATIVGTLTWNLPVSDQK